MKFHTPSTVEDSDEWDVFVCRAPAGTVFHTSAWLDSSPRRFMKLGIRSTDGELVGGCVIEGDKGSSHSKTVTPYQGPLFAFRETTPPRRLAIQASILEAFEAFLRPAADTCFFTSPWLNDLRPFVSRGWRVELRYTHILALVGADALWKGFEARLRTGIRSAERSGLCIRHHTEPDRSDIEEVVELSARSFERHLTPVVYDREEARACLSALERSGHAEVLIAQSGSRSVAAVAIVGIGKRAHYLLGGYDSDHAPSGAVSLLLWEAVRAIPQRGFEVLDFEGSHVPSIDRFFRSFGTRIAPFYEVSHPLFPWGDEHAT